MHRESNHEVGNILAINSNCFCTLFLRVNQKIKLIKLDYPVDSQDGTHREILLNQTEIRLYLPFSD